MDTHTHPRRFLGTQTSRKSNDCSLLSCRANFCLHFDTNPNFLAFETAEKFGTYGNLDFDPYSVFIMLFDGITDIKTVIVRVIYRDMSQCEDHLMYIDKSFAWHLIYTSFTSVLIYNRKAN